MERPRTLSIFLVIVLAAGLIYLGTGYLKARQQQRELAAKLDDSARTLALIPVPQPDLLRQLADAKQANDLARGIWAEKVDTTQVIKSLLSAADEAGVKAIPLTTDEWSTKTIGNSDYRILSIKVSVAGSLANLTDLINRLYGGKFTAMGIETVTLSIGEGHTGGAGNPTGSVTGTLDLAIYSQPPQPGGGQR